jgi:Tfp pilus assembly major pilin PilA
MSPNESRALTSMVEETTQEVTIVDSIKVNELTIDESIEIIDDNKLIIQQCEEVSKTCMAINDAYEALEKMRIFNLEVEFGHSVDTKRCLTCLRSLTPEKRLAQSQMKFGKPRTNSHRLCLLCGTPTCPAHSDKAFRKSKINVCLECSPLFTLNYIIDCISLSQNNTTELQKKHIFHMMDVYDRVLLCLKFLSQYIDEIAESLQKSTRIKDKVGLGSSASGIMSGIAGVAAAAAILTPAGPPLLIASLLFGGSAQVANHSTTMVNYYSHPNKLATKIITYYNLCRSILLITTILRDALLSDHIDLATYSGTISDIISRVDGIQVKDYYGEGSTIMSSRSEIETYEDIDLNDDSAESEFDDNYDDKSIVSEVTMDSSFYKNQDQSPMDSTEEKSVSTKPPKDNTTSLSKSSKQELSEKNVTANTTASTTSTAIVHQNSAAAKHAQFISRASLTSSSLAGVASFAYLAGGALSVAQVAIDARNMAHLVKRMQAGSPCNKAKTILMIKEDLVGIPDTSVVMKDWENYIKIIEERRLRRDENSVF